MLSIVIPALNAENDLTRTVASVQSSDNALDMPLEIILSDGGSTDGTVDRARDFDLKIVSAPRGRGPQLRAGADAAQGDWLLFLHADTCLAGGWETEVKSFMAGNNPHNRAAVFDFALDDSSRKAQVLESLVRWRNKVFSLPYGDQGLLIARSLYDQIDGFRPLPLFEDVDIIRRLGRPRLHHFKSKAVTSAVRYRRDGYIARAAKNAALLSLYFAGVPPRTIGRLYRLSLTNQLLIFAKSPKLGGVKRRLAADIGLVAATSFYRRTLKTVTRKVNRDTRWETYLALTPDRDALSGDFRLQDVPRLPQGAGTLGDRMAAPMHYLPPGPVVIIGTDIPAISADHIWRAFQALRDHDAVFGPDQGGGYWLVGLKRRPTVPEIFQNVRWSTPHSLEDTLANLRPHHRVAMLETLIDVDDGESYRAWSG